MSSGADLKAFLRSTSTAASRLAMACIMLIFSAITGPARWACSHCCCFCRREKENTAPRDLELGDLERERWRNSSAGGSPRRGRSPTRRDRGIPHPDEFEVYGNHWDETSLDSLTRTRSLRVPTPDWAFWKSLEDAGNGDELLHPDVFDIHTENERTTLAGTTAENTPEESSSVDLGFIPLRAISTLDLDYYEEEDYTGDSKATTVASHDFAVADSDSSAPSSSLRSFSESLPLWIITPKATARTKASRFIEVDVDSPDIAPPDFGLVVEQQELLERRRLSVRTRGNTWHAGQESSRVASGRAGARHSV